MVELFIGIDPDVDKSGIAVWDKNRFIELTCLPLWDLFACISSFDGSYKICVRIEAGWLSKGLNWHKAGGLGAANAVGRNHEIGRQLEKFCVNHSIQYELVKPQGYSSWTHDEFCLFTGWNRKIRTNSETRVAAMMVYGCVKTGLY